MKYFLRISLAIYCLCFLCFCTTVPTSNHSSMQQSVVQNMITWTRVQNNPFGTSNIACIAFGNNIFVAGGENGKIAYSEDGIIWEIVKNSTFSDTEIGDIVYGNGRFVAVGENGETAYSDNGIIWIKGNNTYNGYMAYGKGMFIIGGNDGNYVYSNNGIDWINVIHNIFVTGEVTFDHIAYGEERFITGRFVDGKMSFSDDGITWIAVKDSTLSGVVGLVYGNGIYVATGSYGNMAYSSDNCITWNLVPNIFGNSQYSIGSRIMYGAGKFVAVGSGMFAYSNDGVTWTTIKPKAFGGTYMRGVAYGKGRFVTVGYDAHLVYSNSQEN